MIKVEQYFRSSDRQSVRSNPAVWRETKNGSVVVSYFSRENHEKDERGIQLTSNTYCLIPPGNAFLAAVRCFQ